MDINFSETVGAFLLFGILIMATFVPFVLIHSLGGGDGKNVDKKQQKIRNRFRKTISSLPWFSMGNCLAAGVFLATCFIGLVPHVRQHVDLYQAKLAALNSNSTEKKLPMPANHSSHHGHIPWVELLLVSGFFLAMLVEEVLRLVHQTFLSRSKKTKRSLNASLATSSAAAAKNRCQNGFLSSPIAEQEKETIPENEPLVDVNLQEYSAGSNESQAGSPVVSDGAECETGHKHDGIKVHYSCHDHDSVTQSLKSSQGGQNLSWRTVALLLSLSVHGVFEGVALGLQESAPAFWRLWLGVLTHEVLCAAAFGVQLATSGIQFWPAASCTLILSSTVPWGMLGSFVMRGWGGGTQIRIALEGLAAGTFVYVALFDLMHRELSAQGQQRWRLIKIFCVFAGFFSFFLITIYL